MYIIVHYFTLLDVKNGVILNTAFKIAPTFYVWGYFEHSICGLLMVEILLLKGLNA